MKIFNQNKNIIIALVIVLGAIGLFSYFSRKSDTDQLQYGRGNRMGDGAGDNLRQQDGRMRETSDLQGGGQNQGQGLNRGNCLADDCLLVEDLEYPVGELPQEVIDALTEALEDEYKAYATYDAVINEFGAARPFSMIIRAEEQHINSLKAVFDKYGVDIPENTYVGTIQAPENLVAACETGYRAEIANYELYENELLPAVKDYADITSVFENLSNASKTKHLPAFDRCR